MHYPYIRILQIEIDLLERLICACPKYRGLRRLHCFPALVIRLLQAQRSWSLVRQNRPRLRAAWHAPVLKRILMGNRLLAETQDGDVMSSAESRLNPDHKIQVNDAAGVVQPTDPDGDAFGIRQAPLSHAIGSQ